jgi:hypothetical protein
MNHSDKIFILAECVERDIDMTPYTTLKEAQEAMFSAYKDTLERIGINIKTNIEKYLNTKNTYTFTKDTSDEIHDGSEYDIDNTSAWINEGPNHDNYDWIIKEIKLP